MKSNIKKENQTKMQKLFPDEGGKIWTLGPLCLAQRPQGVNQEKQSHRNRERGKQNASRDQERVQTMGETIVELQSRKPHPEGHNQKCQHKIPSGNI